MSEENESDLMGEKKKKTRQGKSSKKRAVIGGLGGFPREPHAASPTFREGNTTRKERTDSHVRPYHPSSSPLEELEALRALGE